MKNNIYTQIQKNQEQPLSFEDIFSILSKEDSSLTKQTLGGFLRELEQDGLTAEINKRFVDLTKLPEHEGFIHWNLNQLCWAEKTDTTNDYGIAFNGNDNLLQVFNKKKGAYGSFAKGRLIENNEKSFFYITNTISKKEITIFASYRNDSQSWHVLNSSSGFRFRNRDLDTNIEPQEGDICIFKKTMNSYSFIEKFGNISEKGIEGKVIQSLTHIFETPPSTIDHFPKPLKRIDKPFFSIDGIGTKDIDDAIYIEKTKDSYELWVAISDVSAYVKPKDSQDIHAQDKSTSFYFFNNTVHMLSRDLAENYCSLIPGSPKLAMICHLSYDLAGQLKTYELLNAEIVSHARLTYQDVDQILEGNNPQESTIYKDGILSKWISADEPGTQWIKSSLKTFEEFSSFLSQEYKPDYWFVQSPEISIGEDGKVDKLYFENRSGTKSQKIVETAMLAANKVAAQFLCEKYPHIGLFRNQNSPKEEFERPKPAFYHPDNEGHWGLKTEFYTHFTSPIRRFCDLVAHRLIKDVLQQNHENVYTKEDISSIVERINFQQYVARQASNREKNLLMNQYVQRLVVNKELQVKVKVVDFNENGIVVRNNQLIENFIPKFKLDRNFSNSLGEIDVSSIDPNVKEKIITEINDTWKIKCFIDNHHWLDDRKETTYKFYLRDFNEENNLEKKSHVKI